MKKSMFTETDERFTAEACDDLNDVVKHLNVAIETLEAKGYKLRDISYALQTEIDMTILGKLI